MFPRRMSLLEVRMLVDLSLQACPNVTLEGVAVHGECCPSGRDSSLNVLVLVFSLVLYLWRCSSGSERCCVVFYHRLCLRLPVAFVVVHMVH